MDLVRRYLLSLWYSRRSRVPPIIRSVVWGKFFSFLSSTTPTRTSTKVPSPSSRPRGTVGRLGGLRSQYMGEGL